MIFRETFRIALAVLGGFVLPLLDGEPGGWPEALLAAVVTYAIALFAWPPYRDKPEDTDAPS